MNIDVHAHFLPRSCFGITDSTGKQHGPTLVTNEKGEEEMVLKGRNYGSISKKLWDPESRLKDMEATEVDMQVISAIPILLDYIYNLENEVCLSFCRQQNDGVARVVSEYPARFVGLATLPLNEPDKALIELDRAINKLGMRGVEILSNIKGRDLDAPELMPFYKEVEALDVPVFIHPSGGVSSLERMKKYYLNNLVAYPMETAMAASRIVFGGVLEKYPRLKFYLAHAGGTLPYTRGRLEHGYQVRPESKEVIDKPPSHYIPLLYFDTITHYLPALEYLVKSAGADRVMMGTDYPYDMSDTEPVATVRGLTNIPEKDRQLVFGGNAMRLFKL